MDRAAFQSNLLREVKRYMASRHCSFDQAINEAAEILRRNGAESFKTGRKLITSSEFLEGLKRRRQRRTLRIISNLLNKKVGAR